MMTKASALKDRLPRLSPVWIVPLAAFLIGLWLAYDHFSSLGPEVTLVMSDASGIEADKTEIKMRSVPIGKVDSVRLSDDFQHAIVTARLQQGTKALLAKDSQFWVVKPRIGREGISGLGTVLSGAYIALQPGKDSAISHRFEVRDTPPVTQAGTHGLSLKLVSKVGSRLRTGDPVVYHGMTVGKVVGSHFDPTDKRMHYQLFIKAPFDVLVSSSSRFWNVSGFSFEMGVQGFDVHVPSLETLLSGGVAFDVPDSNLPAGRRVHDGKQFELYPGKAAARHAVYDEYMRYVILFKGSVRGLKSGAPVEYRGVRVGTVEQVPWHFMGRQPKSLTKFAIPVLIHIEPQRVIRSDALSMKKWRALLEQAFNGGLRATLESSSLITGALYVNMSFHDKAAPFKAETFEGVPVFPSTASDLKRLENKVNEFMTTLNDLPLGQIADNLNQTLAASKHTMTALKKTSNALHELLSKPSIKALPSDAIDTLNQLKQTLKEADPLIRTLRENPNALIFDDANPVDLQPGAAHE